MANAQGQWHSIDIRPGEVAVLIGHTAETASAGVLQAASSRVVSTSELWPVLQLHTKLPLCDCVSLASNMVVQAAHSQGMSCQLGPGWSCQPVHCCPRSAAHADVLEKHDEGHICKAGVRCQE